MFPVTQRVPRESFKKILTEGIKSSSGLFLMRKMQNNIENNRVSVVVSKKVSLSAAKRNLIRRRYSHAMRTHVSADPCFDYILLAQPPSTKASFEEISKEVKNVL
jgi:ribonuclease P protein component